MEMKQRVSERESPLAKHRTSLHCHSHTQPNRSVQALSLTAGVGVPPTWPRLSCPACAKTMIADRSVVGLSVVLSLFGLVLCNKKGLLCCVMLGLQK